jgi:hypothetical protein
VNETLTARRHEITDRIEEGYSPTRHIALLVVVAGTAIGIAASGLSRVTRSEWAVVFAGFLFANFGEWALHRYVLHEPTRMRVAYERHARTHHVLYTYDAFEISSSRELRFVLMPWFALPAMLVTIAPLVLAIALAWSANAARLFAIVGVAYYLVYEVLHALYHLPAAAPIARLRVVQALRRLHRVHHEPSLMRACNFNVTFPVADALLGTWRRHR